MSQVIENQYSENKQFMMKKPAGQSCPVASFEAY